MQEYQYKPGSRFKVPAQVVGEEIAAIEAIDGQVTPSAFVERARPEDSPVHPLIEWDVRVAAAKYQLDQARQVIRSVYPVHVDAEGHPQPILGWAHVDLPDDGPCYVSTARAMSEPELKQQVEAEALRALEALRQRYAHILSLEGVFREIDLAVRKVKARKPAKREARPCPAT